MAKRVLSVVGVLLLAGAASVDGKRRDCTVVDASGSYASTPNPSTTSTPSMVSTAPASASSSTTQASGSTDYANSTGSSTEDTSAPPTESTGSSEASNTGTSTPSTGSSAYGITSGSNGSGSSSSLSTGSTAYGSTTDSTEGSSSTLTSSDNGSTIADGSASAPAAEASGYDNTSGSDGFSSAVTSSSSSSETDSTSESIIDSSASTSSTGSSEYTSSTESSADTTVVSSSRSSDISSTSGSVTDNSASASSINSSEYGSTTGTDTEGSSSAPAPSASSFASIESSADGSTSASSTSSTTSSSGDSSNADSYASSGSSSTTVSASASTDYSSWSASIGASASAETSSSASLSSLSGSFSFSGSSSASQVINWVGPAPDATDSACYRKTHIMETCPTGYETDDVSTCWAQCPLDYPVECGMECIPQNADCTLEVLSKIGAVANVAFNTATAGVFGNIMTASKAVQTGVLCGQKLFAAVTKIVGYLEELQTSQPNSTEAQLQFWLMKSSFVVSDVPTLITTCLGKSKTFTANAATSTTSTASTSVVSNIVAQIVANGKSLLTWANFVKFLATIDLDDVISSMTESDMSQLQTLVESDTTCGESVQNAIDKTVAMVVELKTNSPDMSNADIRLSVSNSDLFLITIPSITTKCMADTTQESYDSRNSIRKALLVLVDKIIDTGGDADTAGLIAADYVQAIAELGLSVLSTFDTTGIVAMAQEFIQPICGPTSFIGEVDDGSMTDALGLTTEGDAFAGSEGTWTKSGDGIFKITFVSSDTKDVTVVIHSGGDTIEEVDVDSGETVEWSTTIAAVADKTLYLDRWRPGFLGLPGSGGGSLLSWISRSSEGGHLELTAKINVS